MFDKRLMILCPESRKYIVFNILLQWLELLCNAGMVYVFAFSVHCFYERVWTIQNLKVPLVLIILSIAVRFLTTYYAVRMSWLASRTVKKKLREQIYSKLLRLGSRFREQASTAEIVQESVEGVDQLENYFGQYVPQFFYAFLAPVTLFFLFGAAGGWSAAIVLLICVPLIPGAIMMVQKFAKKLLAKYWSQYTQLGSAFLENLQGMTTLKIYQADEFKNKQMNQESEHFRFITMKVLNMQLNSIIIMDFFAYGGAAMGILLACRAFANSDIPLWSCIFMILLSAEFFLPMRKLGSYFHIAMNGLAASDKIFRFLSMEEPEPKDDSISDSYAIRLDHVTFSYDGERDVLKDVDIEVDERKFIGIVGESGSGKSTTASLLMGRIVPVRGSATIDGRNVTEIAEDSLMKNVTYIGHAATLFKGTVRDNLLIAKPDASDEELWRVLRECEMAEFLKAEKGLDTVLVENARNLSGGQRQRLALARALLHDSQIYILDEATSNIDVESEQIILSRIKSLRGYKTILMISHRLANVQEADCIYVMKNGEVAESGTHSELLQTNGTYAELWKSQTALETYGREAVV